MNGLGRGEKNQEKKFSVITRETVGMTFLLFSIIIFFIAVTGRLVFGDIGTAITSFFVGLLGFFVYPFLILAAYLSLVLVTGKRFLPAGWLVKGLLVTLCVFFIVHTATAERFVSAGYGGYLAGCWNAAQDSASGGTGGGILFGIIAFPVRYLLSAPGAYIVFSLLLILSLFYVFTATPLWHKLRNAPRKEKKAEAVQTEGSRAYPGAVAFDDLEPSPTPAGRLQDEPPAPSPAANERRNYSPSYQPTPARSEGFAESREILFQSDPADNYTSNLIFDRNSRFNTTARKSSVQYVDPNRAPSQPVPPAPPRYSAQYAKDAETTRTQMPRRVTGGDMNYSPHEDALNYPKAPSYRAPEATGEKKPFTEPLTEKNGTPAEMKTENFSAPVYPKEEHIPPAVPPEEDDDGVVPLGDPRELPPVRGITEESALSSEPDFPADDVADEPAVSKRRTSLHDYLSRASEDNKKKTPPLEKPTEEPQDPAQISRFERIEPQREEHERRFERFRPIEEPDENEEAGMSSEENVFDASRERRRSVADLFDDDEPTEEEPPALPERARPAITRTRGLPGRTPDDTPVPAPEKRKPEKYIAPDFNNLFAYDETITVTDEEVERNVSIILDTLNGFNIDATFLNSKRGPAVTQYNIDIPRNVSVSKVISRDAEIAMRLHAKNGINIYSNPMAEAISIEVPNAKSTMVSMRTVMQADEYKNAKPNSLVFTMGMSIEGKPVCGDIVSMKHILMAGATGSGKSVMMNSMLVSLLYKYSPEDLRLILIDPKKVEFGIYEGIPHLMIREVIADEKKVVAALAWAVGEMERRYTLFEKKVKQGINVRAIDEYNEHRTEDEEKLPKLVIVIDELADLMATVAKDIEVYIQRIAQKARAAGIHLVLATQRPSADIITGIIKANLPTRIAFHVAQEINSRIILDETGADKLLGNGDMLYKTEKMSACQRLQGVFIDSKEVEAVIKDIKDNNHAYYDQSVDDYINKKGASGGESGDIDDKEVGDEYIRALRVAVELGQASISLIQRKCSVGYNHAGKIIEWMEAKKYITPFDGKAKARTVLLTKAEFEELYGGD